jgi:hypothetical protein
MINLRYHIVSITAVFLALGIGVTLGSSMIQRYTIETLEDRLDELGDRLDRTDGENSLLRSVLNDRDRIADQLAEQGPAVLGGHLEGRAVLVLAVQGTDDDLLSEVRTSLRAADAEISGTLVFTTRWDELTEDDLDELSDALGRRFATDTLARSFAMRGVASELSAAAGSAPEPEPEPEPDPDVDPQDGDSEAGADDPTGEVDPTPETQDPDPGGDQAPSDGTVDPEDDAPELDEPTVTEPPVPDVEVISALLRLGYLEFFPEGASGPLPRFDASYVFVADDGASLDDEVVAIPLVGALADMQPAPIVVAAALGPEPPITVNGADEDPSDRVAALVTTIRTDDRLADRIGTVDALGDFVGNAALVVSVAELGRGVVEHLGLGDSAQRLLPTGER